MTPAEEAAALWGSAQNRAYSLNDRLECALQALEFYGDRLDAVRQLATVANQERVPIPGDLIIDRLEGR